MSVRGSVVSTRLSGVSEVGSMVPELGLWCQE